MKKSVTTVLLVSTLLIGCGGGKGRVYDATSMNQGLSSSLAASSTGTSLAGRGGPYGQQQNSLSYQDCLRACREDGNYNSCPNECAYEIYGTLRGIDFDDNLYPTIPIQDAYGLHNRWRDRNTRSNLTSRYFSRGNRVQYRSPYREMDGMNGIYCSDCPDRDPAYFYRVSEDIARLDDAYYSYKQYGDCEQTRNLTYQLMRDRPTGYGRGSRGSYGQGQDLGETLEGVWEDLQRVPGNIVRGLTGRLMRSFEYRMGQFARAGKNFGASVGERARGRNASGLSDQYYRDAGLAYNHFRHLGRDACDEKYIDLPGYRPACICVEIPCSAY